MNAKNRAPVYNSVIQRAIDFVEIRDWWLFFVFIKMGFGLKIKQTIEKEKPKKAELEAKSKSSRRTVECLELSMKYLYRRAFSEIQLLDNTEELKDGHCYNYITAGDVDSLSYLKLILRHQDLDYCLFSTWCMSAEDIKQIEEWVDAGKIKKLDAYLGEIFPNQYKIEYKMLKDLFAKHDLGRIAVFKNHSKIYAGYGDKFFFGIQTSANINTNPRTENGCVIIDKGIYEFYRSYFDGIKSFEKEI